MQTYLVCDRTTSVIRTIDIVLAADDGYAKNCAATMASILLNSDATSFFRFHILDGGITGINKQKILKLKYIRDFEIYFYDMTKFNWTRFPNNREYISLATYYRLMMADVLPKNLGKVLYLDCDMIIEDDLKKIWEIDISNYVLAAVEDEESAGNVKRLNLPKNYFNAGVLLVDLSKLRQGDLLKSSINYLEKNKQVICYQDQDILNGLFSTRCKFISLRWNVNSGIYIGSTLPHFYTNSDAEEARKKPAIIHYTGPLAKPWEFGNLHPLSKEYWKYLEYTEFKDAHYSLAFLKRLLLHYFE